MISKQLRIHASEFLNKTIEEIEDLIKSNPDRAINDWNNKNSIKDFYKTTDVYIYGLIGFWDNERLSNILHPIRNITGNKILDYGAGIGVLPIILGEKNQCYYYDLPSKTQDFARFLNSKTGNRITFIEKEEEIFTQKFDMIITTDVLEHLENPLEIVKKLTKCLESKGFFFTTGLDFSWGPHTPMHLTENLKVKEEYMEFMFENYKLYFFHSTPKESIYVWVKQ